MDITNAESAYLAGHSKFERWKQKFDAQWYRPIGLDMVRTLWESMTDEAKEKLKEMDRESYDYLMDLAEQGD